MPLWLEPSGVFYISKGGGERIIIRDDLVLLMNSVNLEFGLVLIEEESSSLCLRFYSGFK